jgi:hypothetical protein
MPERETMRRAMRAKRQGKAASTQAGEFVREEVHHVREGRHGARSTKQAIAIGLSKARRSGVKLRPPRRAAAATRRKAAQDVRAGQRGGRKRSATRARGVTRALEREGRAAASPRALSRQARRSAKRRGATSRRRAARKAAATRARRRASA